ncbi:MAG: histidine phosphatase family protein [Gammaproteobacteria bacterium]|nr:histidine phosphatase family protein [Gammaproteobacteria bacterium]
MPLDTRIIIVRHGETEWNKENRLQGNRNSPLTPAGLKQADAARKALVQYELDCAYVSPLERAIETSKIILKERGLEAVIQDDLREISLGPWEGRTRQETALSHPKEYMDFLARPHVFSLEGADTFQALQQRVVGGFESIFDTRKYSNILVVSHWVAIKVALAYYSSIPLSDLSSIPDPLNGGYLCLLKRGDDVSIQSL